MIVLSGANAFVVNLSIYWVIGSTSALTYFFKIFDYLIFELLSKII